MSFIQVIEQGLLARWRELTDMEVYSYLFFHPKTFGDAACKGMVLSMGCDASIQFARSAHFPIVNVSEMLPPVDFVHNVRYDNHEIIRLAVDHLWGIGYRKFLFLAHPGAEFSDQRWLAMKHILEERGCTGVKHFSFAVRRFIHHALNTENEAQELRAFLPTLGSNVGIVAANDATARFFIEALNAIDPGLLPAFGIVGVDDDYSRADNPATLPQLTSVLPNFSGIGAAAAEQLHQFITTGSKPSGSITRVGGAKLVARLTTGGFSCDDLRVVTVARWIHAQVEAGLSPSVSDVASACKMNERVLYDLFRKEYRGSIRDFIMSARIERAARLLVSTDARISEIAQLCAFNKHGDLTERFQKYLGCTPSEYRHQRALHLNPPTAQT